MRALQAGEGRSPSGEGGGHGVTDLSPLAEIESQFHNRGMASIPLAELPVGACARVVQVDTPGAVGRRLFDLGFQPDALVRCRRRAPLGDPRIYEVADSQLCLRQREAAGIRVRVNA